LALGQDVIKSAYNHVKCKTWECKTADSLYVVLHLKLVLINLTELSLCVMAYATCQLLEMFVSMWQKNKQF